MTAPETLLTTPLHGLHRELGAEFGGFAGYDMPIRYPAGIMAEHLHCRASAALFDVSHMGQVLVKGPGVIEALERLVPGDIEALKVGRQRYTLFTNAHGGIMDDLMVTRRESDLYVVVNAGCKSGDLAHMQAHMPPGTVVMLDDRALVALQGPKAVDVIARLDPHIGAMPFMSARELTLGGIDCWVSRSGYTGEDGVEISVPAEHAETLARLLLAQPEVMPAGLGARDSLRLEAGLCLYGADLDENTTPVEAGLTWTIGKRRKLEGGFLGAEPILEQLFAGPRRIRVGIRPEGKAPARAHTIIVDETSNEIGEITSGGFGPSVGGPVAMGYVTPDYADDGTAIGLVIRGKVHPARIAPLPFVPKGWK
ncbi:glycine cleavage system aminomethyltransferase GcvT [Emcibacter sp. SYSU 3D8]|uniref:glycine cleavage system aminomethyltransferase GcvT n=1 Tax=Emcibacter sp. SYSU 3D8 TaxID=3133969 RepID=UPI0031FEB616